MESVLEKQTNLGFLKVDQLNKLHRDITRKHGKFESGQGEQQQTMGRMLNTTTNANIQQSTPKRDPRLCRAFVKATGVPCTTPAIWGELVCGRHTNWEKMGILLIEIDEEEINNNNNNNDNDNDNNKNDSNGSNNGSAKDDTDSSKELCKRENCKLERRFNSVFCSDKCGTIVAEQKLRVSVAYGWGS